VATVRLQPSSVFASAYRVIRLLGKGSMGSVYLAEELATGEKRALKVLHSQMKKDSRTGARFEREATVHLRIASERVVKVFASGVDDTTRSPWLAMEYVEGESLAKLAAAKPELPKRDARAILEQLFDAVAAAHDAQVVHRDLKPENVIVRRDGKGAVHVKVLDFGLAKLLGLSKENSTAMGLGTPLWTAPEQNKERGLTPAADVWALGLVVFFVWTGKLYWRHAAEGSSPVELLMEISRAKIEPASERARELGYAEPLPEGFDAWFAKCVARDPAERFASAREARSALDAVLGTRRGHPWVVIAVAAAVLVLAAVLAATR
jgi:serine/threonine protein kinase